MWFTAIITDGTRQMFQSGSTVSGLADYITERVFDSGGSHPARGIRLQGPRGGEAGRL